MALWVMFNSFGMFHNLDWLAPVSFRHWFTAKIYSQLVYGTLIYGTLRFIHPSLYRDRLVSVVILSAHGGAWCGAWYRLRLRSPIIASPLRIPRSVPEDALRQKIEG